MIAARGSRLLASVVPGLMMVAACGGRARLPIDSGFGPAPALPPVERSLIPNVNVVNAVGWAAAGQPVAAEGTTVTALARGLDHPRWLYVLPNGDVLVAETNAPTPHVAATGLKGWFFKRYQKRAGAAVPSADRITLLRDRDGDGVAETRSVFLSGLRSPFGMVLIDSTLYVANTDALVRFPYVSGATAITAPAVTVRALPAGPFNRHWTKNVVASADGARLYVAIGSASDAGERGIDAESGRAAIWEISPASGASRVFATGLRNPVGMAWEPERGALWVAVNERDELGGDLVPDYMTAVRDSAFYGWPYSYFGQRLDPRVTPQRPDLVARPSHRTTRSVRTRRRSGSRGRRRIPRRCRRASPAACSSGSTDPGTARPAAATA